MPTAVIGLLYHGAKLDGQWARGNGQAKGKSIPENWMDCQTAERQTDIPEPPGPCTAKGHRARVSDGQRSRLKGKWPRSLTAVII